MTDRANLDARLDALEMRIAHQDATIEDLNGVLTAQADRIEVLLRRFALLEDRLRDAEVGLGSAAPNQPPPHY